MKKILIAPRFSKNNNINRSLVTSHLANFFLKKDFLPIMAFFDHIELNQNSAKNLAENYLDFSDALVLQGGENDICPSFYNQKRTNAKKILKTRDIFEIELIRVAIAKKLPILGLCRGFQLLNIFFGGSLHQDLDKDNWGQHLVLENKRKIKHGKIHDVICQQNGKLYHWTNKTRLKVNSQHHQGVDILGEKLQIEAIGDDGLVEAFSKDDGKILGMQWHPELDLEDLDQQKILENWVKQV